MRGIKMKFSIIIPVYNAEKYIRKCIESVIHQTFTDFEAVFVDDCGSDNSIKIVEKYAKNDSRLKIIKNPFNKGEGGSRNTAIDYASGDYTICLDPDDWLELNTLEVLNNEIIQNPDIDSIWFDGNKYYQDTGTFEEESVLSCTAGYIDIYPERLVKLSGYSWCKLFKTSLIKNAGIYWGEGILIGCDDEFAYKFFAMNPKNSIVIENRLYNYRVHSQSVTNENTRKFEKAEGLLAILRNLKNFYIKHDIYDKYKISELQLLRKYTSVGRDWCNKKQQKEFFKQLKTLYNELVFPENFQEFNTDLNPKVSIILPCRNNFIHFDKIIKSIQTQSYRNLELICIFNNNENTENRLNEYCRKDKRIKAFGINNYNMENFGIKQASGDYIVFINEFCVLEKDFIKVIVDKFNETNYPNILVKSAMFSENDNINYCYTTIDDNLKNAIEKGKILHAFKKYLLEKCDYNTLSLIKKYSDAFLICENYVRRCED